MILIPETAADENIWHILFGLAMVIIVSLAGFSFKTIQKTMTKMEEYQTNNDNRHLEFVSGILSMMIELHPDKADFIARAFKGLLR